MTKSTASESAQRAGKGPAASAKRGEAADKKAHLIVPDLDLGDDDDEEDDFRPARGFVPPASGRSVPAAKGVVPPQQNEGAQIPTAALDDGLAADSTASRLPDDTAAVTSTATSPTADEERAPLASASIPDSGNNVALAHELSEPESSISSSSGKSAGLGADHHQAVQGDVGEHSSELARVTRQSSPAVRSSTSLSGLPARRPGRRRSAEPFNAEQPRQRNEQAMRDLAEQAPGYASLLTVYSASQLNALPFENRNINLYGLTADQLGTQRTADMALLKTLTLQRPKLTPAHYVDAALEPVLRPLDPEGIDMDAMEDERDYVWELAQKGLAYRKYILSDPESAKMSNYRPVCSLRADVNARLTRMMDLMDSIQGIQAKPFEIVSACLAEYVASLPNERPHLSDFFRKHMVTTVH